MSQECEKCHRERSDVKFRDEFEVPENEDEGFYCEECLVEMNHEWWENESEAYIYDNEGNRADSLDFDSDNSWDEDDD